MRRKPFLALSGRALPGGVPMASPGHLDEGGESVPLLGLDVFSNRALLALSRGGTNYDTLRYLPIRERNLFLFSFFGGPLDISFNSSV